MEWIQEMIMQGNILEAHTNAFNVVVAKTKSEEHERMEVQI
jgi:hypothetical protein